MINNNSITAYDDRHQVDKQLKELHDFSFTNRTLLMHSVS